MRGMSTCNVAALLRRARSHRRQRDDDVGGVWSTCGVSRNRHAGCQCLQLAIAVTPCRMAITPRSMIRHGMSSTCPAVLLRLAGKERAGPDRPHHGRHHSDNSAGTPQLPPIYRDGVGANTSSGQLFGHLYEDGISDDIFASIDPTTGTFTQIGSATSGQLKGC
jgi:hypothetical protein